MQLRGVAPMTIHNGVQRSHQPCCFEVTHVPVRSPHSRSVCKTTKLTGLLSWALVGSSVIGALFGGKDICSYLPRSERCKPQNLSGRSNESHYRLKMVTWAADVTDQTMVLDIGSKVSVDFFFPEVVGWLDKFWQA